MAVDPGTLPGASELNGTLLHENYMKGVQPFIEYMDPVAALFESAGPGEFEMVGEKLVWAARLNQATGLVATGGYLPQSKHVYPVRFEATPARMYVRRAVDHFWQARGTGAGAFEDYNGEILEQAWEAFERGTGRHINSSSNGTVCLVDTRTSATVIVVKDGYGVTGTDPLMFIEAGADLAWCDASNSFAVGGAGTVASVDVDARTITFSASIENGTGTPTIASGDTIVFATGIAPTATNFETERGNAPLGMLDLFDPFSANSSYLGLTESGNERIKPLRMQSADFGEIEVMKFLKKLQTKSQAPVNASTHVLTTQEGVTMELARTLVPYTQIQGKGQDLPGGWTSVKIGGNMPDFVESAYHWHNVINAFCLGEARVIDLDGRPDIWAGDGAEWSRLVDFDGSEMFLRHYVQRLFNRRNRFGSLHTIATTDDARDFSASAALI